MVKRYLKRGAIACIIVSMIFLIYPIIDLPFTACRLMDASADNLEVGAAYQSDHALLILNEYAKGNDGKQLYYTAITYDSDEPVLFSVEFGSNTEIGKRIHDYSDIQIEDMVVSGYFRTEELADKSSVLRSYYNDVCEQLAQIGMDYRQTMLNLRYVCDTGESLTLHSISTEHIVTMAIGLFLFMVGCMTLRKQGKE